MLIYAARIRFTLRILLAQRTGFELYKLRFTSHTRSHSQEFLSLFQEHHAHFRFGFGSTATAWIKHSLDTSNETHYYFTYRQINDKFDTISELSDQLARLTNFECGLGFAAQLGKV